MVPGYLYFYYPKRRQTVCYKKKEQSQRTTRATANPWNILGKRSETHSYAVRVVDNWNGIRGAAKERDSLLKFKSAIKGTAKEILDLPFFS